MPELDALKRIRYNVAMDCKHCGNSFTPKQVYCTPKCRIGAFRNGNVTKRNANVSKLPKTETVTLHETEALQPINASVSDNEEKKTNTKKIDKSGYCPHGIASSGYCRAC